jgi:hypothetical protein
MGEAQRSGGDPKRVFISHSAKDRASLDKVIHLGSIQGADVVDAIRQRQLVEFREFIAERDAGLQEELRHYFDSPRDEDIVVVGGNNNFGIDRRNTEASPPDHVIPPELHSEPAISASDSDAINPHNLYRASSKHTQPDLRVQHALPPPAPPPMDVSRILSAFLSGQNRESFIGDLEERYARIFQTDGSRSAVLWFWRELFHSLLALGLESLIRLSGVAELIARYRRIGS